MAEIDDDAMLDAQAAERLIGLRMATLAKMRCLGGGPPFVKAGRRVLYRRADIKAWLDARRVKNTLRRHIPCRAVSRTSSRDSRCGR